MKASGYDRFPVIKTDFPLLAGYDAIGAELERALEGRNSAVLVLDGYPGTRWDEIIGGLMETVMFGVMIDVSTAYKSAAEVGAMLAENITDDRVFGVMCDQTVDAFLDERKLEVLKRRVREARGLVLVYGEGAALVAEGDVLVYADLARWEIQQRYRSGEIGNWIAENRGEETLRKFKRGYFIDWRVHDRHKHALQPKLHYVMETNKREKPVMIKAEHLKSVYDAVVRRPFRVTPYFDPGVWGGQWMKTVCGLDPRENNYAWSFDGVPEENSLLIGNGETVMELPAMNLVQERPQALLGQDVFERFGAEFPIRFDLLDTIGGQNLSLQVHPLKEYIAEKFGMRYTQDESYYILDCEEDQEPCVYLGVKNGTDPEQMLSALEEAQETGAFDAERFVNSVPAHKHDHFLIPAGTVHGAGHGTMVLEISATPYIFTFKLWDWGRVGLDGKPRPIHLEHGRHNIRFERDSDYAARELVGRVQTVAQGEGWCEERTGLHETEFIETRRHRFTAPVQHDTCGTVNVLNLVGGSGAVVESPDGAFEPFAVHYAETFILPASVGRYCIRPQNEGEECVTMKAYVRAQEV